MVSTGQRSVCQIVCWGLAALAGLAGLWFLAAPAGTLGAILAGLALAVMLGIVLTRLACHSPAQQRQPAPKGHRPETAASAAREAGTTAAQKAKEAVAEAAARSQEAVEALQQTSTSQEQSGRLDKGTQKDTGSHSDTDTSSQPHSLTAPRGGDADDLKQIKGIGPKLEALLNEHGIYHFDQIAGWEAGEVAWMDNNLKGFHGRVSRDGWVDQARILAAGGQTEFSARTRTENED